MKFPTSYSKIIKRIENINANKYAKTRNSLDGAVTYLSPYLTRGVITLPQVRDMVLEKFSQNDAMKLIQELAWREYFQKAYREKGGEIFDDLRFPQPDIEVRGEMPLSIINATTGIGIIDTSINELYETGYMHNHARMWNASLVGNIGRCHWLTPSRWMYYYLLDGDLASNSLSWQWVTAAFSSKKYVAHQELLNACAPKSQSQTGTFIDMPRENLLDMELPAELSETVIPDLRVFLPQGDSVSLSNKDLVIFHPWNLDPKYHAGEDAQKVLIIEPSHFEKFPISEKVMNFIIELAKENIDDIQIYVGEFNNLVKNFDGQIYYQYHKNAEHFTGTREMQNELFPEVQGYYKNFFSFWKQCQKFL